MTIHIPKCQRGGCSKIEKEVYRVNKFARLQKKSRKWRRGNIESRHQ